MEVGYFAYGSNLDPSQMKERVGDWIASKRSLLKGYKLVFNVKSSRWNGFAANLRKTRNENNSVYGVVYFLKKEQLDKMTTFEGPNSKIESVTVVEENGNRINDVSVYWWDNIRPSQVPPTAYSDAIIRGLKQHGYSQDVIEKVKESF